MAATNELMILISMLNFIKTNRPFKGIKNIVTEEILPFETFQTKTMGNIQIFEIDLLKMSNFPELNEKKSLIWAIRESNGMNILVKTKKSEDEPFQISYSGFTKTQISYYKNHLLEADKHGCLIEHS
ncbi:hypothetical protein [Leptospira idonii]|uniref:Uncharacterized protein n=1 Tax=Leptospira idonii TaxID=1193500 RepID=A0A4R9M1D6_9LEPT|nr:hypothetical protein [Leptospira idonii]TGN20513.1 hypothetical protein EHS15_03320 [Leptospira idonii]